MLVATGAAEVLLFLATVPFGMPIPLLAVQLLWLNLVTNGIQVVMLAAEKAEGDELAQPPRRPGDPLFDRIMVRRIVLSAALMAVSGVALFIWQLNSGMPLESVRNQLLLQFVIFENVLTLCARSERSSVLGRNFFRNPLLLVGVVVTQLLHAAAMYLPALSGTLEIEPISPSDWAILIAPALFLMAVLELDKYVERRRTAASDLREVASR
jgi:Ca2+-transporting ATPase